MARQIRKDDDVTRKMLDTIRNLQEAVSAPVYKKSFLYEEKETEDNNDAIAITDDPKFGQNVLTNQIKEFRSSVESGAEFSKPYAGKVSDAPLIYMPKNGNLIFSGVIPCLNNMKFQFVLKTNTGNGCFIWADGLILNKDNMQILNKLFGFYQNWRDHGFLHLLIWRLWQTTLRMSSNIFYL